MAGAIIVTGTASSLLLGLATNAWSPSKGSSVINRNQVGAVGFDVKKPKASTGNQTYANTQTINGANTAAANAAAIRANVLSNIAESKAARASSNFGQFGKNVPSSGARFGNALSNDYRATFFDANPGLQGQVIVHHAVEQQVLTRYPGIVTEAEMYSLENLRGIPNELNSDLHLSQIRREWNQFYRQNPNPTKDQLLQKATEIDGKLGNQFNPPVGP